MILNKLDARRATRFVNTGRIQDVMVGDEEYIFFAQDSN